MSLDHPDEWAIPDHAGRFEAANVSYLSAYLLDSALAYLSRFPAAQLESHSVRLTGLVLAGFARLGLEVTTPEQPERRAGNATCVVPAGVDSGALAAGSRRRECWCGAVTAACAYHVTCTTMQPMSNAYWQSCPPPSRRPDHHEHWSTAA